MCYLMRRALALALLMLMMTITPMPASAQGTGNSIVINEILVSVNNANFGGTDWNGDGSMGSYSDQYVELYNPCLLYTSPSPRDLSTSRMPSSA